MQTEINGVPDKYLEVGDYIVYVIPDNFVVAKVTTVKKEDSRNYGMKTAYEQTYHSNLKSVYNNLCKRVSMENFPDITNILKKIDLVESKLDELLNYKDTLA